MGWSWSSRGTDELSYPGWSLGPSVFSSLVYFKLGERWCHPRVTDKETDAKTDWDPCLRARTLEGAPRTGPTDLPYRQWLWEVQGKEVGEELTEKGMWRKLTQENQGKMFGTHSEAVRSTVWQERKETGEARTEQRQELTEEGPPALLPGAPV